jgi:two-component system response regulator HydG
MHHCVVLCIDDSHSTLDLRKATLESLGYSVRVATSSYSGLKIMEEETPTVVLLEYKQEGMDAEAVAIHVKQRYPYLPIILLSGYVEIPERVLWLADEYVLKSAPLEELGNVIERVYQTSNCRKERHAAA